MRQKPRVFRLFAIVLASIVGSSPTRSLLSSQIEPIIVTGQPAPGTGGGVFTSFGQVSTNDPGLVAFNAGVQGGTSSGGVFLYSTSGILPIALAGAPAPGTDGVFEGFRSPVVNELGDVLFWGRWTGSRNGLFLYSQGKLGAAVLEGQIVPGLQSQLLSFADFSLNNTGAVAFTAGIFTEQAGNSRGLFLLSNGVISPIVLPYQTIASDGKYVSQPDSPSLSDSGAIALVDRVLVGPVSARSGGAIYLSSAGTLSPVVMRGQAAPGSAGAFSLSLGDGITSPSLNKNGALAFIAALSGGTSDQGVFVKSNGSFSRVALKGEPVPGVKAAFDYFSKSLMNDTGTVLFLARLNVGTNGVFVAPGETNTALALEGEAAPDSVGGKFGPISDANLNNIGTVAFVAKIAGGSIKEGIFIARVPEPTFITSVLFPRPVIDPNQYTGIAIVNLDTAPASLRFTAFDGNGSAVRGPNITNPVSRVLNPGSQIPIIDTQIFGDGLTSSRPAGWFKLESTVRKIAGFFLLFDPALTYLDGANFSSRTVTSLLFPEIETGSDGFTQIHIANPNSSSAQTSLELVRADGSVRARADRTIEANGSMASTLPDLFAGVLPSSSDYVRATPSLGVAGYEFLGRRGRFVEVLNGQETAADATTLYCPQYVVGGPTWRTTLSVVNQDNFSGAVRFRFISDGGAVIGTRQLEIPPRGKLFIDEQSFFLSAATQMQGYVEIISNGPRLAGSVVFGDQNRGMFSTALPLVSNLQNEMIFGQVASAELSSPPWFTGLAILNGGSADANAIVQVFDENGAVVESGNFVVPARRRISQVLTQYFPDLVGRDILKGYIRVTADQPLASFALFGNTNLSVLSAISPQSLQ